MPVRRRRWLRLGAVWLAISTAALVYQLERSPRMIVRWVTESEVNTAGFNLYRGMDVDGPFERLNQELIAGAADPLRGGEYRFVDRAVQPGEFYVYRLEEVEVDGATRQVELAQGTASGQQLWALATLSAGILVGVGFVVAGVTRPGTASRDSGDGRSAD